jgi:hypothetical protein
MSGLGISTVQSLSLVKADPDVGEPKRMASLLSWITGLVKMGVIRTNNECLKSLHQPYSNQKYSALYPYAVYPIPASRHLA